MMPAKGPRAFSVFLLALLIHSSSAFALPTMIRLGYNSCAACHVTPQGGGLLTPYGKGIDTAQSLQRREITAPDEPPRSLYDVRFVLGASRMESELGANSMTSSNVRMMLRNMVMLSSHASVSYQAGLDTAVAKKPAGNAGTADFVVSKALFEYRFKEGIAVQVGRDTLPTGLGLPDPQTFARKQNDLLGTAYPFQAKAFIGARRFELAPYAFGPGFDETTHAARQHGGGVVGGIDVWKQNAVLGMTARASNSPAFDRRSVGAYARLGFGRWGILTEHDVTSRVARTTAALPADYVAGFTQFFVAPKEWFVTSLLVDDVVTSGPGTKHQYRLAPTAQMRISDNVTFVLSTRDEYITGVAANSRTYSVTVAVKSVR
jgi:hypothetical protein